MFAENNYDPANVFIIPNLYQKEEQKISTLYNFFWDRRNILIGLNYTELQKISSQYKHFLYNQLGIAKMFYSVKPTQNNIEQMFYDIYNLHGIGEIF